MVKIDNQFNITGIKSTNDKISAVNNNDKNALIKGDSASNVSFQHEIEASILKMESITAKIRNSFQEADNKIDTAKIVSDVKEARQLLDELTTTFSSIKKTNQQTGTVNESIAINKYQQSSTNINKLDKKS